MTGEAVYAYTWLHSDGSEADDGSSRSNSSRRCWRGRLRYPPAGLPRQAISHSHRVRWRSDVPVEQPEPLSSRASGRPPSREPRPLLVTYGSAAHRMLDWSGSLGGMRGAVLRAERPDAFMPPVGHAVLRAGEWVRREALLWRPLVPRASTAAGTWLREDRKEKHLLAGAAAGTWAREEWREERVLATPSWLYCLDPKFSLTAGWASGRGRPPCAVLHLVQVEMPSDAV